MVRILLPPDQVSSGTTHSSLEAMERYFTGHSLRLSLFMASASIRTSFGSMRAAMVSLDEGFWHNNFRRSAFRIGWQWHICLGYKTPPVENPNRNLPHISSGIILLNRIESAVFKIFFLDTDSFSDEVLNRIRFMNCHVNVIRYINWRMKFIKRTLPSLGSAPNELTVQELESIQNECRRPTTDT